MSDLHAEENAATALVPSAKRCFVKGTVGDKEHHFEVRQGTNLLGAALKAKVRVDHICRIGLCGTCQVLVLKGGAEQSPPTERELFLLDEEPLNRGVRLACQLSVQGDLNFSHPGRQKTKKTR